MNRYNTIAIAFTLITILLSGWVSYDIYEGLAQLEDEYAYHWQAKLTAEADLKVSSPPEAHEFLIPFVVDYDGERFGKYPLGWPVVLSFGERLGFTRLVNPLLAGLAVWLTYRLGQKLLGDKVGLLAAGLTTISPLFLTYSGSILSHTWGLVLSLCFAISWLDITADISEKQDAFSQPPKIPGWLSVSTAGLSLGVLALSRPWTALGVAIPFGVHGIFMIWRGPNILRKKILLVGVITLLIGSIHFLWQFALTGNPLLNPYLLWWPYDKIGFGPGIGVAKGGHTLQQGWINTKNSLRMTWRDLWGLGRYSWMLPMIGLVASRRHPRVWLIASVFPSLVIIYLAYWVSGPRYFYEGLYSLTIPGAAGIAWIAGWMPEQEICLTRETRIREGAVIIGLVLMVFVGMFSYTPQRIQKIKDHYGFTQAALEPFRTPEAQEMDPALVIIHTASWRDYGVYLHLQNPYLTSPFIFTWALPKEDPSDAMISHFPTRRIYHYYPDQPGQFYSKHLP
jgi:4-amino-4-deoxy-L-arabinose transferase-like glycosyltransferase